MKNIINPLNLIYFCTAEKGPSGGAKIVYNHSGHINKLNIRNLTSEIIHIKKKQTSKWNTSFKKLLNYNGVKCNGFPLLGNFSGNILISDILDDDNPEIIVREMSHICFISNTAAKL